MKALLAYAGTQPTSVAGCVLSVEASVLWLLISGCCAQREGVGGKVNKCRCEASWKAVWLWVGPAPF